MTWPEETPKPPPPPRNRAMRREVQSLWAAFAHLGPLIFSFVAPLAVWLVFRRRSDFLRRSAKEALNMQLSYLLYLLVAAELLSFVKALILLVVVVVAWLVLMFQGARAAMDLKDHRYPGIIRFLS